MFNKITQNVKNIIIDSRLIKEMPCKNKDLRDNELWLIITPSKNLYRVIIWNEDIDEYFETLKKARKILITKSDALQKGDEQNG